MDQRDLRFAEVVTTAWSTLWRSTSPTDTVWLKESTAINPAEGSVHAALATLAPDLVTAPLAWDDQRGWLLTRHGGSTVADAGTGDLEVLAETTQAYLQDYALLQASTVGHRPLLERSGLPQQPPSQAAEVLKHCVSTMASYPGDDPRRITRAEADTLLEHLPSLNEAAAALNAGPVPLAFDHNDLFPRNVFLAQPSERYRFFDFAESIWAHPFGSLVMLLWELVHRFGLDTGEHGPIDLRTTPVRAIFDAYLEQWTEYADLGQLRVLAGYALQIAPLYRTATWLTVLQKTPSAIPQHGTTPRAWIFDITRPVLV